jgi:hypothetical protein
MAVASSNGRIRTGARTNSQKTGKINNAGAYEVHVHAKGQHDNGSSKIAGILPSYPLDANINYPD